MNEESDHHNTDVVALGTTTPEPRVERPHRGLHRVATSTMAGSALAGVVGTIAFITVSWGDNARYVAAGIVLCVVTFMASAAAAVFTAASATYARGGGDREGRDVTP